MADNKRIPLGTYSLPEGFSFRLAAEVRESDSGTLVVAIYAAPSDSPEDAEISDEERARYSIWLAKIGDRPWVPVDHAQGLGTIAEKDGQPYLYWHGKAPGTRPFN